MWQQQQLQSFWAETEPASTAADDSACMLKSTQLVSDSGAVQSFPRVSFAELVVVFEEEVGGGEVKVLC